MPPERRIIVTEDRILDRDWGVSQVPAYKVSVVAQFFFAMSPSWLRGHIGKGAFSGMKFRRSEPERGSASARLFLLSDIQPMAELLFAEGKITAAELTNTLNVVASQAALFGLIEDPEPGEAGDSEAADAG